ncbi:glutaminase A [Nannocystis radixulma]|uniref:Glutaminase n=1 Tax=Nannocystis radixulma TaxID=2995305 RepID=A0ABT5AY03_9BACT|nr:glutaminase A [Nannocystis radixulma]MDC0666340.1 glutaminase A [Nannocystis radixulma]
MSSSTTTGNTNGNKGRPGREERREERDAREYRLLTSLDSENKSYIYRTDLEEAIAREGLSLDDYRFKETRKLLAEIGPNDRLDYRAFCEIIRPSILLAERALQGNMVIRDFDEFCRDITEIYQSTLPNTEGKVASYIPQLARVNPDQFAVSLCTVDGQRLSLGDSKADFSVQSTCKPINYSIALQLHGEQVVHGHVGREPSGRGFNELTLNHDGRPHNPMINAGAIMCCSLLKREDEINVADRFDLVMDTWRRLSGGTKVKFNNSVYLSERTTADRNFALGYFMREQQAFPASTDLLETLEFYFQCCSIEVNAEQMAAVAATLANGGICPISGERVFETKTVQHCLSLMYSCGMYDYSGEFAFTIGLPAKSGVAGALMIVVPNVMGICTWSPRLDKLGNSVRGIEFCRRLVATFNFHNYDTLTGHTEKKDPRISRVQARAESVNELIWAASKGDLGAIQRLVVRGTGIDRADYDRRTPLHLAAAEGQVAIVEWFIGRGTDVNPRDRWDTTPLDDAYMQGHEGVIAVLEKHGGVRSGVEFSPPIDVTEMAEHNESGLTNELIWAAALGEVKAIQRLIARGVDLDGADYDRRTPLHLAAAEGHAHVVKLLLDQGVRVSPKDRWGGTPLDDARRHRHGEVVSLLDRHSLASRAEPAATPEPESAPAIYCERMSNS